MKRNLIVIALAALLPSKALTYDVEIDGVYYNADIQAMEMCVVSGDKNYSGSIAIPSHVEYGGKQFTVTQIGGGAFCDVESEYYNQQNSSLLSVSLPKTIRKIGSGAFARCPNLASVNIPEACTYIDSYAFEGCSSLKSINIPKNVTAFGQYSIFSGCTSLTEITIEDGSKEALDSRYGYGGGVGTIDAVKTCYYGREIGFSSKNLENLTLGDSLKAITSSHLSPVFRRIPLKHLRIPANIASIGYYAFSQLDSLSDLIIADSSSPLTIGTGTFGSSESYYNNSKKRALYIGRDMYPRSINSYNYNLFEESHDFQFIAFGEFVTSGLGEKHSWDDDYYCKWNFSNCQDIEEIYVRKEIPFEIPFNTFCDKTYLKAILYVPKGSKQKYMECEGWKNFFNIQEMRISDMWDGSTYFEQYKKNGNNPAEECKQPYIEYENGMVRIFSETEGAKCFYSISDDDIVPFKLVDKDIPLSATYQISAYATAEGYSRSKTTYATICWIDGNFESDGVNTLMARKRAIIVSSNSGILTIRGLIGGEEVICHNLLGRKIYETHSLGSSASIPLSQEIGKVVIIRIGNDSIKVVVR